MQSSTPTRNTGGFSTSGTFCTHTLGNVETHSLPHTCGCKSTTGSKTHSSTQHKRACTKLGKLMALLKAETHATHGLDSPHGCAGDDCPSPMRPCVQLDRPSAVLECSTPTAVAAAAADTAAAAGTSPPPLLLWAVADTRMHACMCTSQQTHSRHILHPHPPSHTHAAHTESGGAISTHHGCVDVVGWNQPLERQSNPAATDTLAQHTAVSQSVTHHSVTDIRPLCICGCSFLVSGPLHPPSPQQQHSTTPALRCHSRASTTAAAAAITAAVKPRMWSLVVQEGPTPVARQQAQVLA